MIRVNLFLEQQNGQTKQVGVRLLKTEKSETPLIENLLLSNCISLLRKSLGLSTMDELDCELAKRIRRTVPVENLNKLLAEDDLPERRPPKPVIEDLLTGDLASDQLSDPKQPNSQHNSLAPSQSDKPTGEPEKVCKVSQPSHPSPQRSIPTPSSDKFAEHEYPTLLHFAAEFNLKQFASSLLEFEATSGVCCSLKNCHGLTALSLAKLNGHHEISQLIKRHTKVDQEDQIIDLSETEPERSANDLNYVNMSTIRIPGKPEQTSDFTTDSSDQSSLDGVDSVDGLIIKRSSKQPARTINDFIDRSKPIRLGKLIDLDSLSTSEETSGDDLRPPPKSGRACPLASDELRRENFDYDIVKASPRRADLGDSPSIATKSLSSSFSNREKCKVNLFERFDGLRVSSSSSSQSQESEPKSIDLQTSNLTESQIELLNIIKAFKMGCYTNDEMEVKFKQWAAKYKYKIDQNNRFETDAHPANRMGKRSVSSSHLLSQEAKLESKDSGCSSRSSTIKTCLSNINLHAAAGSPSKYGKQFSLTDWFHTLTAKLKQKTDKNDLTRKSPKFESAKFEKKVSRPVHRSHVRLNLRLANCEIQIALRSFSRKEFSKNHIFFLLGKERVSVERLELDQTAVLIQCAGGS